MEKYDYETQMKYYLKQFNETNEVTFDPNTFREALDWRIKFKRLANQCVNFELKRQFSIMGYSAVEYCVGNQEEDSLGEFAPCIMLSKPFIRRKKISIKCVLISWVL